MLVTFKSDFYDMVVLQGFLPKIIWIRTGNIPTKNLEILFKSKHKVIEQFFDENFTCLEIIE